MLIWLMVVYGNRRRRRVTRRVGSNRNNPVRYRRYATLRRVRRAPFRRIARRPAARRPAVRRRVAAPRSAPRRRIIRRRVTSRRRIAGRPSLLGRARSAISNLQLGRLAADAVAGIIIGGVSGAAMAGPEMEDHLDAAAVQNGLVTHRDMNVSAAEFRNLAASRRRKDAHARDNGLFEERNHSHHANPDVYPYGME